MCWWLATRKNNPGSSKLSLFSVFSPGEKEVIILPAIFPGEFVSAYERTTVDEA
jgi:hypothetical protein